MYIDGVCVPYNSIESMNKHDILLFVHQLSVPLPFDADADARHRNAREHYTRYSCAILHIYVRHIYVQ